MHSELFGSYIAYLFALVCVNYKHRWLYYFLIIIIGHFNKYVPLFMIGAAFADLEA